MNKAKHLCNGFRFYKQPDGEPDAVHSAYVQNSCMTMVPRSKVPFRQAIGLIGTNVFVPVELFASNLSGLGRYR